MAHVTPKLSEVTKDRTIGSSDWFELPEFSDDATDERLLMPIRVAKSSKPKTPVGMPAYLASLWNAPLLTAEQEYHCFRKLNYLKFLAARAEGRTQAGAQEDSSLSDPKRFAALSLAVRNEIVESNLRLVVSLAKKYSSYGSNEFDEMVGVGNAALLRAVDLFDFRRGSRFSTYAYQAIQRSIFSEFRREGRLKSRFVTEGNEAAEAAVADAGQSDLAIFNADDAREQAIGLMEQLGERDRQIVMARFGINRRNNGVPFHVIAKEIGLSTTRTMQLFHRSIESMRSLLAKRKGNAKLNLVSKLGGSSRRTAVA